MELEAGVKRAVLSDAAKKIMLVGGPDSGKTTLAETLLDLLSREGPTGILDLDMGQSHIGPPTTLAWGLVEGGFRSWADIAAEEIYFTGTLSPVGSMLPSITGARLLMDSAIERCARLVIDTTGLVAGAPGRIYKQYKIDLLRPDLVIALEYGSELEHILAPYSRMDRPAIVRLDPSPFARAKGVPVRAGHRAALFRAYFEKSRLFEVDLGAVPVRYTREEWAEGLEGRLLSFRDGAGRDICLGVIEGMGNWGRTALVRSPLAAGTGYACVVIGRATVEM